MKIRAKSLKIRTKSLNIKEKSLKIWAKWPPTLCDFKKWRPSFAEKQAKTIFWGHTKKRLAKVARQLFGQVWENLGKNPLHPQKAACSWTYDRCNFFSKGCTAESMQVGKIDFSKGISQIPLSLKIRNFGFAPRFSSLSERNVKKMCVIFSLFFFGVLYSRSTKATI